MLWRRRERDHDLDRELRDHLDLEAEEQQQSGMNAVDARDAARRAMGNTTSIKEAVREMWGWRSFEGFLQDLSYAARMLRKSPGFALAAIITLALGIGVNTVIFSAVNAVLLRPLPFREPGSLMQLWETHPVLRQVQVPYPDFNDWREQARSFEQIAANTFQGFQKFNLVTGGEPEQVPGTLVSDNLLPLLGITPLVGRNFLPSEVQPGLDQVAILSHSVWERRFGRRPDLVGQYIQLNGETLRVVGILAPGAQYPAWADILLPISKLNAYDRTNRKHHELEVLGRLKPSATPMQAHAELQAIAQRLERAYPATNNTIGAAVVPLQEQFVGEVRTPLLVLLGAVGLILLIACANVANLLLARAAVRRKEIAIRIALGAGRGRLIVQLLIESSLLSACGAALGLTLAAFGIPLLRAAAAGQIPRASEIGIDAGVLFFTATVAVFTGILFGLAPALQSTRQNQDQVLRETGRISTGHAGSRGVRRFLVAGEVALAMLVLVSAGLLVRSFGQLLAIQPGFRTDHLLTFQISLPGSKYQKPEQIQNFHQQLLAKLHNLPGVQGAASVGTLPFTSALSRTRFGIEGAPPPEAGRFPVAQSRSVSPGYLHLMGIPLRQGRQFTEADNQLTSQPVCIINETLAHRFYPHKDPIGRRLLLGVVDPTPVGIPIVGVIADIKDLGLAVETQPAIYFPGINNPTNIVVRTAAEPSALLSSVRREVLAIDSEQPIASVRTMDDIVSESLATRRFSMMLLTGFSGLALLLAAVGLYGLVSYAVAQRTHEMGLRMALGASRREVFRLVLGESVVLSLLGLALGLAAAFGVTRFLSNLLYGVTATDPLTFAGVSLLLLVVAGFAAALPAQRATRVDPMVALRYE